jgi:nitrite reductase/ring-hydroxylating ferredoxin subunit
MGLDRDTLRPAPFSDAALAAHDLVKLLCRLDELPDGGVRELAGGLIAWRRGAEVRVFVNRCPHFRIPLNFEPEGFNVYGELLQCAHHYSYFRFADGACVEGPSAGEPLEAVAVRVEADAVYLT